MARPALERSTDGRNRNAKAHELDAADAIVRRDAIVVCFRVVALDEIVVERGHRLAVVPLEVHHAVETIFFVVRVHRKIRARVELAPNVLSANERVGAVVDRRVRREWEERRDLHEEDEWPRENFRVDVGAGSVEPDADEKEHRENAERALTKSRVQLTTPSRQRATCRTACRCSTDSCRR